MLSPTRRTRRVAVVGAGPAGLGRRGDRSAARPRVTLFEAGDVIGGQFDLARRIPGKEEFSETIRYYTRMLDKHGVDVRLNTRAGVDELSGYDDVVLATGVTPRMPDIPGIDHPMVLSYAEAIMGKPVGKRVAVVGAGGIGFDVSEFLVTDESADAEPQGVEGRVGRGRPAGGARRADDAHPGAGRPRGVPAAAHQGPAGSWAWQDVGLGAPGVAEGQGRHAVFGRELRAHRRRRPAHQLRS